MQEKPVEIETPEVNVAELEAPEAPAFEEPAQEIEAEQQEAAPAPEPEPDEITVMIGDEPVEEKAEAAPEWVRELRKKNREDQKRIRELEAKLASQAPQPTLTKKPILEEFDYDTDKYEEALAHWIERKKQYDYVLEAKKREEEEQNQSWQQKLESYAEARTSLKVKDFEDAESTVAEMFNVTQQGVVIQGAENPALLVYALGKNPKKAKELASITDPVKFAFAIAKLETQLKVTGKRTPPPPEKTVGGGTAPIRGAVDSSLDRLREEAARTGDYSKVYAYKKQKRA
jgi:hypothetical protein